MKKPDIPELHYITSTRNVRSILDLGILCRGQARELVPSFVDLSDPGRQTRRVRRSTPDGRSMLAYVNLFLNPISADDMFDTPRLPNGTLAFKNHMPEILIPDRVAPCYIRGAYVGSPHAQRGLYEFDTDSFPVSIRVHLFGGQRFGADSPV